MLFWFFPDEPKKEIDESKQKQMWVDQSVSWDKIPEDTDRQQNPQQALEQYKLHWPNKQEEDRYNNSYDPIRLMNMCVLTESYSLLLLW